MSKKTEKEISECIALQKVVCERKDFPHFAPDDGQCWKCHRNIYQNYENRGKDGSDPVTGCPHCYRSYCD